MFRFRFFWRLYLGYAALIGLVAVTVGLSVSSSLKADLQEQTRQELFHQALFFREWLKVEPDWNSAKLIAKTRALGATLNFRLTLIDDKGKVLLDSEHDPQTMENHSDRPEILAVKDWVEGKAPPFAVRMSQTLGFSHMYLAVPIAHSASGKRCYARVSVPLTQIEERIEAWYRMLLIGVFVAAVLGLFFNFILARWLSSPLSTISALAESVARNEGKAQDQENQDEIGTLAWAFTRMSESLRQRMETTFRRRREIRAILEGMIEGVVAVGRDETIVQMNQVAASLLKTTAEESIGRKIWESARIPTLTETVTKVLKEGQQLRVELKISVGVEDRVVDLYAAPLEGEEGEVAGAVLVLYDVTRLRRLEAIRRDFIANVSHELKTPLTAIRGLIETMIDDQEMPATMRQRFLTKAEKQTSRLSQIVVDLLHLSRVESEKDAIRRVMLDLRSPIRETIQRLAPLVESKNLRLEAEIPDQPLPYKGDFEALQQLVGNLLTNAVQYSPPEQKIILKLESDAEGYLLSVQDFGTGIEARHQERIFQRFYRVDKARSRELGGTGLGLSIVKHIALAHDGQVWVESVLGQGSTFFARFQPPHPDEAVSDPLSSESEFA
ncbi:MAG: ATP-binding protein [Planctomycetota bacterium]|nr:ATP-binding protein [Planctomycetota bacterium]